MLSLKFSQSTAEESLWIATSSIDSVKVSLPWSYDQTERYFSTLYLTSALTVLSCIITKEDTSQTLRLEAIESFKRGIKLLEDISNGFILARRMLQRFQKVIKSTSKAISFQAEGREAPPNHPNDEEQDSQPRCMNLFDNVGNAEDHDLAQPHPGNFVVSHMPTPSMGDYLGTWDGMYDPEWMPTAW